MNPYGSADAAAMSEVPRKVVGLVLNRALGLNCCESGGEGGIQPSVQVLARTTV
jgi:hypothetical protein